MNIESTNLDKIIIKTERKCLKRKSAGDFRGLSDGDENAASPKRRSGQMNLNGFITKNHITRIAKRASCPAALPVKKEKSKEKIMCKPDANTSKRSSYFSFV
jgi:hypothetical protein